MHRYPLALALATTLCASALAAQEVTGTLTDAAGRPVRAAVVLLLDSAGTRRASMLSDERGGFRLRAPGPGTYRVRAERVGFQSTGSAALTLAAGETRAVRLTASTAAVTLEGIVARGRPRCRMPRDGGDALIWEEARKALAATEEASRTGATRFQAVVYRRQLDPTTLAVRREELTRTLTAAARPFGSIDADSLLRRGFVIREGDSVAWHAPDESLLLSDAFLNTHCFAAVPHPDSAALIGLRFTPVPGRRQPEVTGTLWLDRRSSALRWVEYRYVNAGWAGSHRRVGGRVEFEQLPSGLWLVRRWYIRMPSIGPEELERPPSQLPEAARHGPVLRGLLEVGGEVQQAGARRLAATVGTARLEGVVWDSIRGAPLADAEVYVSQSAAARDRTGSAGTFALEQLGEGEQVVSFTHPMLELLGVSASPARVGLRAGQTERVTLATPSGESVVSARCAVPGTLVAGEVVGASREAQVWVEWNRGDLLSGGSRMRRQGDLDARGRFLICGVDRGGSPVVVVRDGTREQRQQVAAGRGAVSMVRLELPGS